MASYLDTFPFLKLPLELRQMIYKYSVISKQPVDLYRWSTTKNADVNTALFRMNRQINQEAMEIFYFWNTAVFCHSDHRMWQQVACGESGNAGTPHPMQSRINAKFSGFSNIHIHLDWLDVSSTMFSSRYMWFSEFYDVLNMLDPLCETMVDQSADKTKKITLSFPTISSITLKRASLILVTIWATTVSEKLAELSQVRTLLVDQAVYPGTDAFWFDGTAYHNTSSPFRIAVNMLNDHFYNETTESECAVQPALDYFNNEAAQQEQIVEDDSD